MDLEEINYLCKQLDKLLYDRAGIIRTDNK